MNVWRDLHVSLRAMRKNPGFTLLAVLTLGLGIGANTAIFTVVNSLLIRPLALGDPDRLLFLMGASPVRRDAGFPFSLAQYETIRDHIQSFSGIAAFCREGMTLTGAGDPAALITARVSPNFFDVLQVRPLLGRSFTAREGEAEGERVALISHSLWERYFGSDAAILGMTLTLGQEIYSIAGVMPPGFPYPYTGVDVWTTRIMKYGGLQPSQILGGSGYLAGIARLKPGVTLAQAAAELAVIHKQYHHDFPGNPDADANTTFNPRPLQESLLSGIRPTLLILSGVVGFVLLIACANVAGLVLTKATGRARELAVRAALGASRSTLAGMLLVESLLLGVLGAVLGVLLAHWGIGLLVRAEGTGLPGFQTVRVDLPVLAFTLLVSLAAGVVVGLFPALQVARTDLNSAIRDSGWGTTPGSRRRRIRNLLVIAQMALSIVMLIGAGLLIESFRRLQTVDTGFDPANALTMQISLPPARYPGDAHRARFIRDIVNRLEAIPGVRSAAASLGLPMNVAVMAPFLPEGQPEVTGLRPPLAVWSAITPDYFRTLGIPLLRGRPFTAADDESAPRRVIVSQSLAHRFWPNEDPVGKHFRYTRRLLPAEVVGVAADVRNQGLDTEAGMAFYTPYPQFAWPNMAVTIRTQGNPQSIANAARSEIQSADHDLPVTNVRLLQTVVDEALLQRRQLLYLIGGFAAVALLLALLGLYGAMAFSVAQRTAEIGIRQAIGARQGDILLMVLREALGLSFAGSAAGIAAALGLTRLLSGMLYGVSATDPVAFAVIPALFVLVSLAASYFPARRAARVDPITALRIG